MQSTPSYDILNEDLFNLIPRNKKNFVDVGCMLGTMAKAVREHNQISSYVGIDIDESYTTTASRYCSSILTADIENLDENTWERLFPSDCWIFGDCLEHLRDPWKVLRKVRDNIDRDGALLVCLPNAQHWSVQIRLATGQFHYEKSGLMDQTHLRWFTRTTMITMFSDTGWEIVEAKARYIQNSDEKILEAIGDLAGIMGFNKDVAKQDANVFQYLFLCRPKN
jgi:2-polyprenyl-3-methyl-5-hydroxy-6-metoxy-1,4-benzoquinol methylase